MIGPESKYPHTMSAAVATVIFKPSFFGRLEQGTHKPAILEVAGAIGIRPEPGECVRDYYERVYAEMVRSCRCEYVVKNEMTNRIFLARHNLTKSTLLSEMRVGTRRVDFVVINGSASAYEIKTEFDSLKRLESQVAAYIAVFARVHVVAAHPHVQSLKRVLDDRVGILTFSDKGALSAIRRAADNTDVVCPDAIFDIFRMPEYLAVVKSEFGYAPQVPNTKLYDACKGMFSQLKPRRAHEHLVNALKRRAMGGNDKQLLAGLPYSLKQLFFEIPKADRQRRLILGLLDRPVLD